MSDEDSSMGNRGSLPTPQGYSDKEGDEIRKKILTEHNRVRVLNNVAPIIFDEKMNKSAQEAANSMAQKGKLETANSNYGEILYSCSGTGVKAENVVNHFYTNPQGSPQMTQIISPKSRRLGVGVSRSKDGKLFVCLLYSGSANLEPQSNITLEYGNNNNNKESSKTPEKSVDEYRAEILADHNQLRAKHSSGPLKYDAALNKSAQAYADKLAKADKGLTHSETARSGKHSENLYAASGPGKIPPNATRAWYDEISKYDFSRAAFSPGTGHFTALVWRSSSSLGVGIAYSKSGSKYVVAQYQPVGNVSGRFAENVLQAK